MDSVQFNQLVQEVREALESGSQGVGEVQRVTSLSGIVSLPALRLIGASESVVEAPLELLSAPAVEAAADSRKATEDATIAAVNASAAADLSEAERKDLADIKEQTLAAGNDSSAKGDKAFRGAMNAEGAALYAMQVASLLQGKLAQAQVVILSGKAGQEVIETLESKVQGNILICASTREEAYSAILQLRELQIQVAQAIVDAYVQSDSMRLSTADARLATELANKAATRLCELSEQTERVIVESVIQTGEAGRAVIRLEDLAKDLLFSMSAADIAARQADEQADKAKRLNEESERLNADNVLLGDRLNGMVPELEKATEDAKFSAAGADAAAAHASEQSEAARKACNEAERLNGKSMVAADRAEKAAGEAEKAGESALLSKSAADAAAARAEEQSEHARKTGDEAERLNESMSAILPRAKEVIGTAEQAIADTLLSKAGADTSAAHADEQAERARQAALTAENMVLGIRPDWTETEKTNSNYIANKPEIPTLETPPTAGTLTYVNRDGNEVAFRVGDEVRVLEDEEYIFYKLYDLTEDGEGNPVASWDESGSGTALPGNVYLQGASYYNNSVRIIEEGLLNE